MKGYVFKDFDPGKHVTSRWGKRGWKVLLVIALTIWVIAVELRLNINLDLHNITFDTLEDHTGTSIMHMESIDRLERIHLHELEEVGKWEEYYDTPAGQSKPTESKASK